jgi:carbon storage regulator CsrA|tara:strand:+ start:103 stop:279 length:177 start_codon:yes stop_codon:yes gene_type:complete
VKNLILTRRKGEKIVLHIDNHVLAICTVTGLGNKQVKLAFEADKEIKIDREEIYQDKL